MNLQSKQVLIMSGLPGGGKSHLAKRILDDYYQGVKGRFTGANPLAHGGVIVSTDSYFQGADGEYRYIPSELPQAHKECWNNFDRYTGRELALVIVDNTNLAAAEIAPYYLPAEARGYQVTIVRVACDPADAFLRQRHGVMEHAYAKMVDLWNNFQPMPWWNVEEIKNGPQND